MTALARAAILAALVPAALAALVVTSCGAPERRPRSDDDGEGGGGGAALDAAPELSWDGNPYCSADTECDDGFSCTLDKCNQGFCGHAIGPNSGETACPTGEYCVLGKGCVKAKACASSADCADDDPCTSSEICDPATSICLYETLDKDNDGHPPQVCGGDDCDDSDGSNYPGHAESCDGADNDCDGIFDEAEGNLDVLADPMNCGACENVCPQGAVCNNGKCECSGGPGYLVCDDVCYNGQNDPDHCGACGTQCNWDSSCVGGVCQCYQGPSYTPCGDSCHDLSNDYYHCGACDKPCPSGASCVSGACQCYGGPDEIVCNNVCVAAQTDESNCGACGVVCAQGATCVAGTCQCPGPGWGVCGGVCVDLQNDTQHCGGCGVTCPMACAAGSCATAQGIAAGGVHTCARMSNGAAKCWGEGFYGQLGEGNSGSGSTKTRPVSVVGLSSFSALSLGAYHTCARKTDGTAMCWGFGSTGALGDGTWEHRTTPKLVPGLSSVTQVAAGGYYSEDFTCALLADGTGRCFGFNEEGELGDGSTLHKNTPVTVVGLAGAQEIRAGAHHACARMGDGTVKCWGSNWSGQFGNGSLSASNPTPVVIAGLSNVAALAAGYAHTCVQLTGGTLQCHGNNDHGQLGDGSTQYKTTPTTVALGNVSRVVLGNFHTCALMNDGTVRCWGMNTYGQIGIGSTVSPQLTPVVVPGLSGVLDLDAGDFHTCAVLANGTVRCWGDNGLAQLGDGTLIDRTSPTPVAW